MQKAVFRRFIAVIFICLLLCCSLFSYIMSKEMLSQTKQDMLYSLLLMDYGLDYSKDLQEQIDKLNPLVLDNTTRITIIDKDGEVLADTSTYIDYEENHHDRPEFKEAEKNKIGINIRYSKTVKKTLLYAAYKSTKSDNIIRLSIPYNGLVRYLNAIIPATIVSSIFAFFVAFFIAKRLSKNITEPLDEISQELLKIQNENEVLNLKEYKYDEINDIAKSTKILSDRIDKNVERLKYEKNKTDYIFDNMSEGIILLDENKDVLTINKAAMRILECQNKAFVSKNIVHYTQNMLILDGVVDVLEKNKDSLFDITDCNAKTYSVHITKVKKGVFDKAVGGAIILLVDVTIERENQRIRQEFFSNASHELKTPITSIQGYSELLTSPMEFDKAQQKEFLNRIKNETQNMTALINDILMISRLEAKTQSEEPTEISIKNVVEDIIKTTEPLRSENNINITANLEDFKILADYKQIYQMLNNLIVNAIKYNKPNGSVNIDLKQKDNYTIFEISDTGIGIPKESQQRVFERFFRVDKGRSKKMGGTGLGLAIVKHVVGFYKGKINLTSKLDEGTKITISIPDIIVS